MKEELTEEQKKMARKIAERILTNPEILDRLKEALESDDIVDWNDGGKQQ